MSPPRHSVLEQLDGSGCSNDTLPPGRLKPMHAEEGSSLGSSCRSTLTFLSPAGPPARVEIRTGTLGTMELDGLFACMAATTRAARPAPDLPHEHRWGCAFPLTS